MISFKGSVFELLENIFFTFFTQIKNVTLIINENHSPDFVPVL